MVVKIKWDNEVNIWVATNYEIGLTLESGSYDALIERIKVAVPELIELNGIISDSNIDLYTEMRHMVC